MMIKIVPLLTVCMLFAYSALLPSCSTDISGESNKPLTANTEATAPTQVLLKPAPTDTEVDMQKPVAPLVFNQAPIGPNACGPVALYNSLVWGDSELSRTAANIKGENAEEKIRNLISAYGSKPSEAYGNEKQRYDEVTGMAWSDLTHFTNGFLQDNDISSVQGEFLDRKPDEKLSLHLHRIFDRLHKSLDMGFPPLLSIRSFEARAEGQSFSWLGLIGHWVTIVELPDALAENEKGFRFGFADPVSGKVEYGYAYIEEARDFVASKGNLKDWEWVEDRPFLLVTAPSQRLRTQKAPWFARTTIILNYAITRE